MSKFFIKHPIIAMVISIVMVLLGGLSMMSLPVTQYPDIVPPTINLQATYPGADAQTVADSVASPIEQNMSGVDDMEYMYSTNANNGVSKLSIVFEVGTDPNMDQTLTYMRYAQSTAQLPAEVSQMGVTLNKSASAPLALVSLYSPDDSLNAVYLANYAYVSLVDPIKRIKGVGDVQVFGSGRYAMRIWLDTTHMAAQNISIAEVRAAIVSQNTVNPSGQVGAEPAPPGQDFTYTVRTKGRLMTPEQFGNIIIRADGSNFIYLKDIAKIELGSQTYSVAGRYNGKATGAVAIYQSPGTNAITTVDNIKKEMETLEKAFPNGLKYKISLDTTLAVRSSIEEIKSTIIEALILVIIVVFVFLQGWRATLIPAIAVPVSIIGTFAIFPLIGFSLNTICLMGMVLAIGLVVDDAIVVVEAVEAHMDRGLSPRQAAFAAMEEVSGPVIAIALVLAAVFLPSLLLPGITGTLFQQFAVTIAISMLISAFNALTLSPALASVFLKPKNSNRRGPIQLFYNVFNKTYDFSANKYTGVCKFLCRKLWISMPLLVIISLCILPVANKIPGGFLPEEDQGYLFAGLQLKDASSLQLTSEAAEKVEKLFSADPNVEGVVGVMGFNMISGVQCTNNAFFFVTLKPWEERKLESQSAKELNRKFNTILSTKITNGAAFCFAPPAIPGVGASGGVTFVLEDRAGRGMDYLSNQTNYFIGEAMKHPAIASARSMLMPSVPQFRVQLDEAKCYAQGVDVKEANSMLQAYMGSLFINYITLYGQQWQVYIQAQGQDRADINKMDNFYVRNKKAEPVPMSSLITKENITGPEFIMRFNLYNAAQIMVSAAPGYSSTQAMEALEETFQNYMPLDMGYDYMGMSFQENKVREGISITEIFALSSIFVFLILAALYEKWSLPLSIFMTVPIAALGAFLGLYVFKQELNLYAQIGLIMLIGLAAKNAILIVEFAVLEIERGQDLINATITAARLRLRPILMTSFAFILGCLPLALASGSGAYSRNVIGIVVIAGMTLATFVGVFLIPCSFYAIMKLFRIKIEKKQQGEDADEVIAMKHLAQEK
ncbi:MAG: efflux RND transporter permease subunit [Akkermansia sp.]